MEAKGFSEWGGLEYLDKEFIYWMREGMQELAVQGEQAAVMSESWTQDTGSLSASVTGFEAVIGDPLINQRDPRWMKARSVGSEKYHNPPEHYDPVQGESIDLGERDDPVGIV